MEERNFDKDYKGEETETSGLSNILIGILLVVIAFLAFNFFKAEPAVAPDETAARVTVSTEQQSDTAQVAEDDKQGESADEKIGVIVAGGETKSDNHEVSTDGTSRIYKVKKGDSLWKIAQRELNDGFLWVEIAKANEIDINKADTIKAGEVLQIPDVASARIDNGAQDKKDVAVTNKIYVVQKGDTLWSIAERFYGDGFKWVKIFELPENNIEFYTARDGHKYPLIEEGMVLVIPEVAE